MYGHSDRTDRQPRALPRAYVDRDVDMSSSSDEHPCNSRRQHSLAPNSEGPRPSVRLFGSLTTPPAPTYPHALREDDAWTRPDNTRRTPSVLLPMRPTNSRMSEAAYAPSHEGQSANWQPWTTSLHSLASASTMSDRRPGSALGPTSAHAPIAAPAPAPAAPSAPSSAPITFSMATSPSALSEELEEAVAALHCLSGSSGSPPDRSVLSSASRDTVSLPSESSLSPSTVTRSASSGYHGTGSARGLDSASSPLALSHPTADMSRSSSTVTDHAETSVDAAFGGGAGLKAPSSRKRTSSEESSSSKRARSAPRGAPDALAAPRASLNPDAWTETAKEAFLAAVRAIPACSRQQHRFLGRNLGRNELIGIWVSLATGEYCGRKRISSHSQTTRLITPENERSVLTTNDETRERLAAEMAAHGKKSKPILDVPAALRKLVEAAYLESTGEVLAPDVSMAELPLPPIAVRYKRYGEGGKAAASGGPSSGSDDMGGFETGRMMKLEEAIAQEKADQRARNAQSKAAHSKEAETRARATQVKAAVARGQPVRAPTLALSLAAPLPPPISTKMTRANSRIRKAAEQTPVASSSTRRARNGRVVPDVKAPRDHVFAPARSPSASPSPEPMPDMHQRQYSGPSRLLGRRPSAVDQRPSTPTSVFAPMRHSPQLGALSNIRRSSITDAGSSPSSTSAGPSAYAYASSSPSFADAASYDRPSSSSAHRGAVLGFGTNDDAPAPRPALPPLSRLLHPGPDVYAASSQYARHGSRSSPSPSRLVTSNSRESPPEDDAPGQWASSYDPNYDYGGRGGPKVTLPGISALFPDAPNRRDYSNGPHYSAPR